MKQNIISKGEVELNQAEIIQALLAQCQEDRKFLLTSVTNYLKKSHGYLVKNIATSTVGDQLIVRANVEFSRSDMGVLFEPTEKDKKERGPNTVSHKKPNKGMFDELLHYLKEETDGGKHPVDFDEAYKAIHSKFPELPERKFMIYCSDKRMQKKWRYTLKILKNSKGNIIGKTLNLN